MTRTLALSLFLILLSAPLLHAQDLSRYRDFSFGMSPAELSRQVDAHQLQTRLIQSRPVTIREVIWWPREISGASLPAEPVWQVLFTFYNDELYRILATYDRHATEGMTAEDLIESISVQYGAPTRPQDQISFPTNEVYSSTETVIARWEDAQFSVNLFRSSFLNTFGLVMISKRLDERVRAALVEHARLTRQEVESRKELDRLKNQAVALEAARQKNKKTFRP